MNGTTRFDAGEWPTPTELVGRYQLVALARTGRNGSVYRAHDTVRNEPIALKVVRRELTGDAGTRAHLVREVRRARGLTHPNLIPTRDLVLVPTDLGADVLVTTEYVPGWSLARRIREQGPLPVPEVLRIGRSVAEALVAAHAAGVHHGDVNPEHVLLAEDGRALLTDFGIGRALTRSGLGEQTDLHGLGVVLSAALGGRAPEALGEVVRRCLGDDPGDRWASIDEALAALAAIADPLDEAALSLPARNLGGPRVTVTAWAAPPELRHLAGGASDELAEALGMVDGLQVRTGGDPGANDVEVRGELQADGPDVVLTVRLVTVPSGWRLWIGRFETAGTGLLPCAQRAAAAIAWALTSSAVPDRPPGPTDPGAFDLWLRGLHEARTSGALDRSTAFLELARGRVPDDPRVLAAVALARLERTRTTVVTATGAIDLLLVSAERLARAAVTRAPGLPEAHRALAEVLRYGGDTIGAAHATRAALALGPSSAEARAVAGALWSEAGDLDASVLHLEQALSLAPDRRATRIALARAWALQGRSEPALLADAPLEQARLGLWFPERTPVEPVCERTRLLAAIRERERVPSADWTVLEVEDRDARVVAAASELVIEARVAAGFGDVAFWRVERAAREGLVDLAWLDRCPVLDPLRADARFTWVRHLVASRARAIGRALSG